MAMSNSIISKQNALIFTASAWGTLGFIRGIQTYNFEKPFVLDLYTYKIVYGTLGLITYLNPFMTLFMVYKELYRFKVNLFDIKMEKQSNFYNKIIF